jgi:hypothetical protein
MIVSTPTTPRPQQRYDHRLRSLVQRTGDVSVATHLGVPRSTARGWLGAAPAVVSATPEGAGCLVTYDRHLELFITSKRRERLRTERVIGLKNYLALFLTASCRQ